jgi:CDP-diacylglycerol--serine O-phosphatidyltransferase
MRKKTRQKIFRRLSFGRILPSVITLSALLVGLTQIRFSLSGEWRLVVLATLGAAFLDMMDGRLARLLNSSSRFGAELDSLSDFVVFGVCPSFVVYVFSLNQIENLGWMVSSFFCSCMCLRLARFNTHDIEKSKAPVPSNFFVGVPAPAGALIALLPVILYNAFGFDVFRSQYFSLCSTIGSGILCISRVPTFSVKKIQIKREGYTVFMLLAGVGICAAFVYTWKTLCFFVVLYIISIFFSYKKAKKLATTAI